MQKRFPLFWPVLKLGFFDDLYECALLMQYFSLFSFYKMEVPFVCQIASKRKQGDWREENPTHHPDCYVPNQKPRTRKIKSDELIHSKIIVPSDSS